MSVYVRLCVLSFVSSSLLLYAPYVHTPQHTHTPTHILSHEKSMKKIRKPASKLDLEKTAIIYTFSNTTTHSQQEVF